jgi:hypothetical protein
MSYVQPGCRVLNGEVGLQARAVSLLNVAIKGPAEEGLAETKHVKSPLQRLGMPTSRDSYHPIASLDVGPGRLNSRWQHRVQVGPGGRSCWCRQPGVAGPQPFAAFGLPLRARRNLVHAPSSGDLIGNGSDPSSSSFTRQSAPTPTPLWL